MADQYGPIFTVRLGSHRGLVMSSAEVAKECFTTKDLSSASRPNLLVAKHMGYDYAMFVFSPHGPYWREIRKIATLELLSSCRLELLKHIRLTEVATLSKELHEHWTNNTTRENDAVLVEMKQRIWDLNLNVVLRMVTGKRYSAGKYSDSTNVNCDHNDRESRRLDLGGYEKAMKKTAKEWDGIFSKWLEEHKRKRVVDDVPKGKENRKEQDFMDVMPSVLEGSDLGGYDADTITKATCMLPNRIVINPSMACCLEKQNLIAGASDTTTGTLTWAISLLLNHCHVLKKAQEELDCHVGRNRLVNESDIANLAYIQAIDCTVGGYHVTRGTRLIPNPWKIQTDPNAWPDPLEFKPERFFTTHKDVDLKRQHFELIPFGSGRRACPGTTFALQMVHLTLASFLQAFEISTPLINAPVDMTIKVTPLELLVTCQTSLPAELYSNIN
ncbi:Cytochrome P450, E-class, group I [Trema orientale]|uniref:Cytochrome P450, E-class, group I n=1 Tax=Trema orientale TaxID=63057 RepID=A0A2P5FN16_TREOI|nr:Cytochrome P450, E-class, group I [Trema orientale]